MKNALGQAVELALPTKNAPSGHHRLSTLGLGLVERVFGVCPPYVGWRAMVGALRAVGIKVGRSSAMWGLPTFSGSGDVCSRLSIGEHCGFNLGCHFELEDSITIEDHVSVGHEVMFFTKKRDASGNPLSPTATAPIRIGEGAWLGARCIIMPGVTVGPGCVIGASVVVTDDLPPNFLLSGGRKISIAKWR